MVKNRRLRRVKKRRSTFLRVLLTVIIVSISSFYFLQSPFWFLDQVLVEGNEYIHQEEILELAGLPLDYNIFKIDLSQVEKKVLLHPLVKTVSINRRLPRTIVIDLKERSPVAILPIKGDFFQIDREGIIIRNIATISDANLPLITGVELEASELGFQIDSEQINQALIFLKEAPKELLSIVQEIDLSQAGVIHLHTQNDVLINFGDSQRVADKTQTMMAILQMAELETDQLQYVDLSFAGPPVIKYRE